jgi:hypothetical protein
MLAVLVAAPAYAGEVETFPMISLPLTLGTHRTTDDGLFAWGVRPEVIAARIDHDAARGWGIGGYAQLERADGDSLFAGGATLVGYGESGAIAVSAGVYRRGDADSGVQTSVFFGLRGSVDRDVPLDLPFGFRLDLQHGDVDSLVVSAVLDTAPLFLVLGGIFD